MNKPEFNNHRLISVWGKIYFCLLLSLSMVLPGTAAEFSAEQDSLQTNTPLIYNPDLPKHQLNINRDIWLTAGGVALLTAGALTMSQVDPLTPAEIDALNKNDINRIDRGMMGIYRANHSGDAVLFSAILMPFSLLALEPVRENWQTYAVMGAEVILLQTGLNLLTKSLTKRVRPYAYDPTVALSEKTQRDARLSFYSGHTGTTAALTFFTARIFSDHIRDESYKKYLWAGAAFVPALAGYLRVSSAHHFLTDTLVGYAVGASIGYFIPELHKQLDGQLSLTQTADGDGLELNLMVNF